MNLPDGNYPEEPVPIALRHEIIATWVKAKQLVQQQIASKHITEDEVLPLSVSLSLPYLFER